MERMTWTKDLIREKLEYMVNDLGLKYMPTRREIEEYYGDTRLTNKVGKTLGYYGWAKELGLPVKRSDTKTGKDCEAHIADLLRRRGHTVEQMPQNYPYDLLVDDVVRVDVKFAHPSRSPEGYLYYSFALRKRHPTCDLYILAARDEERERVFVVPATRARQTQITMGGTHTAYERYLSRYDYIDRYRQMMSYAAQGGA